MYTEKQDALCNRFGFEFQRHNHAGVVAFWTLVYVEPDRLPGFQRSVPIHLDGGVMCENILAAAFRADKSKPYGVIELLTSTHFHASTSFEILSD